LGIKRGKNICFFLFATVVLVSRQATIVAIPKGIARRLLFFSIQIRPKTPPFGFFPDSPPRPTANLPGQPVRPARFGTDIPFFMAGLRFFSLLSANLPVAILDSR
jgi:hypothetical protein